MANRVRCIDNRATDGVWWAGETPHLGAIYTVAREWTDFTGTPVYDLIELRRTLHPLFREPLGYRRTRFVPIIEKKTDISIFTSMLNPSSPKVKEREGVE